MGQTSQSTVQPQGAPQGGSDRLAQMFRGNQPTQRIDMPDVSQPVQRALPQLPSVRPPVVQPPVQKPLPPIVRNDPTTNPSVIHSTTGTTSGLGGWNMVDGGKNPMLNAGAGPSKGERNIHAYRSALSQERRGVKPAGYAQSVLDKLPGGHRAAILGGGGGFGSGGGMGGLGQQQAAQYQPSNAARLANAINDQYRNRGGTQ